MLGNMERDQLQRVREIFAKYPAVALAYFFGSRATGRAGPLSDHDFAIYLDMRDTKAMFDTKFEIEAKLARTLKTDAIDVVILNLAKSPEFKYAVISEGKCIYEKQPFRMLVEPSILNEYFDFSMELRRYGLTHSPAGV